MSAVPCGPTSAARTSKKPFSVFRLSITGSKLVVIIESLSSFRRPSHWPCPGVVRRLHAPHATGTARVRSPGGGALAT
jgi:hypothetical protein